MICTTHMNVYYAAKTWLLAEYKTQHQGTLIHFSIDKPVLFFNPETFFNLGPASIVWIISYYLLIAKKQSLVLVAY